MARETDSNANATEAAANAGERTVAEIAKAGQRAGASAAKAGEKAVAETANRFDIAFRTYGGAMEVAFKAAQDYNTKLIQAFQTNAEANLQLGQTLMQTRSPTDFIATMSKTLRERTDLIAGQTRELAALRQQATRSMIEAMTPGR